MSPRHVALAVATLVLCGCSADPTPGPIDPTEPGITTIPGGPMESTPVAASPRIPTSQQEAQDAVLDYLQRTVDGLPPGTRLDSGATRGGRNSGCDDEHRGPGPGPTSYSVWTEVIAPPGVSSADLISATGDLWRSWGLQVLERDGFEKPNRFGYPDDGYRVQIQAVYPAQYPPSLTVVSPCFPGDVARDDLPFPKVVEQTPG